MMGNKFIGPCTNYRKARKGEIKCRECGYYRKSFFAGKLGRCINVAVGKNHTCDGAYKKGRN
jgi:hypothetical protein